MGVTRRTRYEVLRRDNYACRYCGASAPTTPITVDHVIPSALGGTDDPSNLVTACEPCNSGKAASSPDAPLVADVNQRAAQWAQAMKVAVERRMAELARDRVRLARFDDTWRSYRCGHGDHLPRDLSWKTSVLRFMSFGLDDAYLADAVEMAMGSPKPSCDQRWRYFCGICWREIRSLQDSVTLPGDASPAAEDEFPFMDLFAIILGDITEALQLDERIAKIIHLLPWDVMPEADKRWRAGTDEHNPDSTFEMVTEFVSGYISHDINEIRLLTQSRAQQWLALGQPGTNERQAVDVS